MSRILHSFLWLFLTCYKAEAQYGFIYHDFYGTATINSMYHFWDMAMDSNGRIWIPFGNKLLHQTANGGWDTVAAPHYVTHIEFDEVGNLWVQCVTQIFATNPGYRYDGNSFTPMFTWYWGDHLNKVISKASDGHVWIMNCRYSGGVLDTCLTNYPIGVDGYCFSIATGQGNNLFWHEGCLFCNNWCSSLFSNVAGFTMLADSSFCDAHHYPSQGGNQVFTDPQGRFWAIHTYSSCCSADNFVYNECTNVCVSRFDNGNISYMTDVNSVFDEDSLYGVLLSSTILPSPAKPGFDSEGVAWSAFHHLFKMDSNGNTVVIPNSNHVYPVTQKVLIAPDNTVWFAGVWDSAGILHRGLVSFQQPGCDVHTYHVPADICQGSVYMLGDNALTQDGYYIDTLTNIFGCDSIVHLTLVTHPPPGTTVMSQTICSNESYSFYGNMLNAAGQYQHALPGQFGCDSLIILNLNVLPAFSYQTNQQICQGNSYNFYGTDLTGSGTYYHTLQAASGCDSTIELSLSVMPPPVTELNATICQGDALLFYDSVLTVSGTYFHLLQNDNGCDSLITLQLNVNPPPHSIVEQEICVNEAYSFYGTTLSSSGTYYHILQQSNGCDSIVELHLTVVPVPMSVTQAAVCSDEAYNFYGQQLSLAGTYYHTIPNAQFCDSVYVLELSVSPAYVFQEQHQICLGDTFVFQGTALSESGTYYAAYVSQSGCDSVHALTLAVYIATLTIVEVTIPAGSTYFFNDQLLSQPGNYYDTLLNAEGCDSIIRLELSVTVAVSESDVADEAIRVMPNPVSGLLHVELSESLAGGKLEVLDVAGAQLYRQATEGRALQLDLRNWPAGVYVLRVNGQAARFLKQ